MMFYVLYYILQTQPVIWNENEPPGQVVVLTAKDYDSPENGPPFTFALNDSASFDIRSRFHIQGRFLTCTRAELNHQFVTHEYAAGKRLVMQVMRICYDYYF